MNTNWDKRHGKIFIEVIKQLKKDGIRYFILRNYKELPDRNLSKDVDIIIDPSKIKQANIIIQEVYKSNNLTHTYLVRYTAVYCWHGMDVNQHLSIHIDLIAGYRMKGYEVFTFDELYNQTIDYNGFKVLNCLYEGLLMFIYKQFGYHKPKLKQEYCDVISHTYKQYPEFSEILRHILGVKFANTELDAIANNDWRKMLSNYKELERLLRRYAFRKAPFRVIIRSFFFYWLKFTRIILHRSKYIKSFSVMAPDGAGKTTFLDCLLNEIGFYFTKDASYGHVLHFRPNILPNLGKVGEKVGVMKQDTNYSVPHRAKAAGFISSLVRISYYWLDYIIGWYLITPRDIQYDRFTIFDRYAYDLIVDPGRTRLSLPNCIRKVFVKLLPEPRISFYIDVEPDEIYRRKQELLPDEIVRQVAEYRKLVKSHKCIIQLDGNRPVDAIVKEAVSILLDKFTTKHKKV